MSELFDDLLMADSQSMYENKNILRYSSSVKKEYYNAEEVISLLSISKAKLWMLVAEYKLIPCFLWDGFLNSEMYMNCGDYHNLLNNETLDDATYQSYSRYGDVDVPCHLNFRGYITPDATEQFLSSLIDDTSSKFSLSSVCLIENLTVRQSAVIVGDKGQEFDAKMSPPLYKYQTYKINDKSSIKDFDPTKCMFLKSQVDEFKKNIEENYVVNTGKRKNLDDKELFKLIIPTVIRYMRLKNNREKPNQKSGDTDGIKKDVLNYIEQDASLNFLTRNFKNNWQNVINKKDQGLSIIDKIFEEE